MPASAHTSSALLGLILGTAVGDALGLPMEGLAPARIARRFKAPLGHAFLWGHGMVSDDTEHALFTAQALLAHPHDVAAFRRALAWKLRLWLLGLPAGIGFATLRAILRLWLGFKRPGVYSAGNGPAMRAPVLGAAISNDAPRLHALVSASTALTHTDPRALTGALAVATLAAWAARERRHEPPGSDELAQMLLPLAADADREWPALLEKLATHRACGHSPQTFAVALGLTGGVTGYMYHSVPIAIYAWLVHFGDFQATLAEVIALGGDTDSVAAIAGALAGAVTGPDGIPAAWRTRLLDWPRGEPVYLQVADRLAGGTPGGPVRYFWPGVLVRNVLFLGVVLAHGFRRLAPPY
jgi:ADP-ribosyl-[dinitrogen reductase] hydrolase